MRYSIDRFLMISLVAFVAGGQSAQSQAVTEDEVVRRLIQNENQLVRTLARYHPLVETYLQALRPDPELGFVPKDDEYFLGRLDLQKTVRTESMLPKKSWRSRLGTGITTMFDPQFSSNGFATLILLDPAQLSRDNYEFRYLQKEFLGEVRCLVFDMEPKVKGHGIFKGRIWVEDEGFNIVRFNGKYQNPPAFQMYSHFDSWRMQAKNGEWLPAFVYSEDDDKPFPVARKVHFKAQTRIWGYELKREGRKQEFTDVVVEPATPVRDNSEQGAKVANPVQGMRNWERQAEDNFLRRLEQAGLLASEGDVDKVLCTVVNNLIVTNELNLDRDVRCRVLLTTPLESFNMGNTIVLSRGLVDVLPDEGSLAMVLAYELSHIILGHSIDTKYAFADTVQMEDLDALKKLPIHRTVKEIQDADQKAFQLLEKSPYRDKVKNAGLFLAALSNRSASLPNLIRPTLGDRLAKGGTIVRMDTLIQKAPQLEMNKVDQVASLPLGSRVYVEPWSARAEMMKGGSTRLNRPREKMPFEVAPVMVYLSRQRNLGGQ